MDYLFNDQFVERDQINIDLEDRGYQFGDGVYEVIRVYDGKLFTVDAHLARLEKSLNAVRIKPPYQIDRLKTNLIELVNRNHLSTGMIYLQITRGAAPRGHAFPKEAQSVLTGYCRALSRPTEDLANGVRVCLTEDIRWLRCDIKSLNLLGNVLAKQEAEENGFKEAVLFRDDLITEGSSSNCMIIVGNTLFTHPANNFILNGITRQILLKLAPQVGLTIEERAFSIDKLYKADEVFITSTIQEVMPVIQINAIQIGAGIPGPFTRALQSVFEKEIKNL